MFLCFFCACLALVGGLACCSSARLALAVVACSRCLLGAWDIQGVAANFHSSYPCGDLDWRHKARLGCVAPEDGVSTRSSGRRVGILSTSICADFGLLLERELEFNQSIVAGSSSSINLSWLRGSSLLPLSLRSDRDSNVHL